MAVPDEGETVAKVFDIRKGEQIRDTYDHNLFAFAHVKHFGNTLATVVPSPSRGQPLLSGQLHQSPCHKQPTYKREVLQTSDRKCVHRTDGSGSHTSWSAC
jgi:hypothetical protein